MADSYYEKNINAPFSDQQHRSYIGGLWDEIGTLQFDFLVSQGLMPHHKLVDVGCGSLRGGTRFIDYLDPFHYYGTDINKTLVQAGIERELTDAARHRINDNQFKISDNFDFNFGPDTFDFGLAISLFTHLSENKIKLCLQNLRPKFKGGVFFATVFHAPHNHYAEAVEQGMGIVTHAYKDPFHYTWDEIMNLGERTGWRVEIIDSFKHPRHQRMVAFHG